MSPGDYSQQAKTTEMPSSSSSDREAPNNTSSVDPPPLVVDGIPGQDHVVLAELREHPPYVSFLQSSSVSTTNLCA